MRICCCTIAMRDEPLESQLPRIRDAGYDGAELWMKHLDDRSEADLDALRRQAEDLGLALEVVSPYFWLTQTPELLQESFDIATRAIERARRLGCPKIRTFTDSGPTGIGSAQATPEHWATAVSALRRMTSQAPELRFVVETHGQTLADTPDSTARLLEEVGAPNLCVNFQFSGIFDLEAYERLKPHVVHAHLNNNLPEGGPAWIEDETGVLDLAGFLRRLAQDGYRESVSVEYCFKGATWERLAAAAAYVRRHATEQ